MKSSENNGPDLLRQIEDLQQQVTDLNAALSESRDKFHGLTDSAPVGIYFNDAQGRTIYINNKCAELVGVPVDKALSFDWIPFLHPDDRARIVSEWENSFKNSVEFHSEYRWVHQDGKIVWTFGEVSPIVGEDGKATMFIGTLTDITERKQIEEDLVKSQQLLTEMGKIGKIGGWELDMATSLVTYTNEAIRIHEFDLPYVPPNLSQGDEFYPPEAWPIIQTAVQAAVEHGKAYDLESPFITAKGRHIWVRVQGYAVRENGKTVKLRGAIQDITKSKKDEVELQEAKAKLIRNNKKLEEANIALNVLIGQLEKNKAVLEKNVLFNVEKLLMPTLGKLKNMASDHTQKAYLDILESNLNQIVSPFVPTVASHLSKLTPAQIQVANLIKQGMTTKEIANLLNLSPATIAAQRQNIRKRIAVPPKTPLRTVLLTNE